MLGALCGSERVDQRNGRFFLILLDVLARSTAVDGLEHRDEGFHAREAVFERRAGLAHAVLLDVDQGIFQNTIRLSIGTEHIDDIIADLENGFAAI